jgi:TRAP-type C4-dicarboxylate transport system substrate-binding protein
MAQDRALRFHHFLPEKSPQQQKLFLPWSKRIAEASNGRLRIEVTAGMQLGGKANELLAQVMSKQVDIAWTLAAYTPNKFPRLEVFELPFIASSRASVTSQALFEYYEAHARDELSNVHVLNVWCHPSGVILNRDEPILRPIDAAGRVMRVPSDVIGELFRSIGATPKATTVTQVLTLLKKREIAGTLLPYEVVPTLKLTSEIRHITEFAGHRGLYTAVFLLVMNKDIYAGLDKDLRRMLDANSGAAIAAEWGRIWDDFEEIGRDDFTAAGGTLTFVKNEHYEEWVQASQSAIDSWVDKVGRAGIDGATLIFRGQATRRQICDAGKALGRKGVPANPTVETSMVDWGSRRVGSGSGARCALISCRPRLRAATHPPCQKLPTSQWQSLYSSDLRRPTPSCAIRASAQNVEELKGGTDEVALPTGSRLVRILERPRSTRVAVDLLDVSLWKR